MFEAKILRIKFGLIFLPFLFITTGFISVYTLFNYLFYQTEIVKWNIDLINFWLPMLLPWIPILIWLRPGIKLLRLKQKNGKDLDMLYYLAAWAAATIPTIIAQDYLEAAAGTLTPLSSVEQIDNSPTSKFYTLKEYYIDKVHLGIIKNTKLSGKNNEYLDFTVFVTCPILQKKPEVPPPLARPDTAITEPLYIINGRVAGKAAFNSINPRDIMKLNVIKGESAVSLFGERAKYGAVLITLNGSHFYYPISRIFKNRYHSWLCLRYYKQISNRQDKEVKDKIYNEFLQECERDFYNSDLAGFQYLKRVPRGDDRKNYLDAIKNSNNEEAEDPHMLLPVYRSFAARGGEKLALILKTFLIASSLFALILLFPKLNTAKIRSYYNPKVKKNLNLSEILTPFRNMGALYGTFALLTVNIIVFIIMVFTFASFSSFQPKDLLISGSNFRPRVLDGEWWRLFTNMFLHGGLMHLLLNMYGLLFAGIFLEPLLGRTRFILFYLLTGIISSISSICWYNATISVGASGAIFGLYGIFLVFLLANVFPKDFRKAMLLNTALYVGLNLVMGLAGGTDNAAHIGGLLSGGMIGLLLFGGLKRKISEPEDEGKKSERDILESETV